MALEPITRAEQIMSGESLTPITREEMFLAKAGGQNVTTPTPITRREMFLSKISGSSGGGGVVGDDYVVEINPPKTIKTYADNISTDFPDNHLRDYKELTSVTAPNVTKVGHHAFDGCSKLENLQLKPNGTVSVGDYAFNSCSSLIRISFCASAWLNFGNYAVGSFANCTNLEIAECSLADLGDKTFSGCTNLIALVDRNEQASSLTYPDAFEGTPIANGTGYIYVPSKVLPDYESDASWSGIRFRALEDYTIDGTIDGELDETKI